LSDTGLNRLDKLKLQEMLSEHETLKSIVIPTVKAKQINDVLLFIEKHEKVVLKPVSGQFGTGVYAVEKRNNNDDFIVSYKKEDTILNKSKLLDFLNEDIILSEYIVQKYINSRTKHGHPFDCR